MEVGLLLECCQFDLPVQCRTDGFDTEQNMVGQRIAPPFLTQHFVLYQKLEQIFITITVITLSFGGCLVHGRQMGDFFQYRLFCLEMFFWGRFSGV